ncbi:MAG: sensor histidine kinase [Rubrivivax sp.]|nr:sensor histidine kinase [Rubrivivax sp.]
MNPQLAALAVHDLKNALGALEGELGALESDPSPRLAQAARRHCVELRQRFVAFLMLYRGDGDLPLLASDESPSDFLAGFVRAADPGASVSTRLGDCADAPPFWYFDPRLLRLALDAALHNAWRFARSEVVLDARLEAGFLVLSVDDDGPGLGAAADGGAEWSTGLGTELCREIAHAHRNGERRGLVQLMNRAEGGARFEIWLP